MDEIKEIITKCKELEFNEDIVRYLTATLIEESYKGGYTLENFRQFMYDLKNENEYV